MDYSTGDSAAHSPARASGSISERGRVVYIYTIFSTITIRKLGFALALAVMGTISYLAAVYDTFPGDARAIQEFQSLRTSSLDVAARVSTSLAGTVVAAVSIIALSLALLGLKREPDAVAAFLLLVPEGINLAIKELVGRPRPELSLLSSPPVNAAFPSGHSVHAFLILGFLIVLAVEHSRRPWLKATLVGMLAFMVLACGTSRVYLGVHWPSDVIGGYFWGALSLYVIIQVRKMLITRDLQ